MPASLRSLNGPLLALALAAPAAAQAALPAVQTWYIEVGGPF